MTPEDNYEYWYDQGLKFSDLEKLEDALSCFDKAIEIDEKRPDAWFSKGIVLQTLEKYKDAIECFDKTIERCDNAIGIDAADVLPYLSMFLMVCLSVKPNFSWINFIILILA